MIIVLVTRGKNDSVDYVTVKLFNTVQEANDFIDVTTDLVETKYWTYAEIIDEGKEYEPTRYKNYE